MKKFIPIHDLMLIELDDEETQTQTGLYLPDQVYREMRKGTVLAVGDGTRTPKGKIKPLEVKAGDRVLLKNHLGVALDPLGNKNQVVVKQSSPAFAGVIDEAA